MISNREYCLKMFENLNEMPLEPDTVVMSKAEFLRILDRIKTLETIKGHSINFSQNLTFIILPKVI